MTAAVTMTKAIATAAVSGCREPAHVSGPQPGQAWPADVVIGAHAHDAADEPEVVEGRLRNPHREDLPVSARRRGRDLVDGMALAQQGQDAVRYVRGGDEVAGLGLPITQSSPSRRSAKGRSRIRDPSATGRGARRLAVSAA